MRRPSPYLLPTLLGAWCASAVILVACQASGPSAPYLPAAQAPLTQAAAKGTVTGWGIVVNDRYGLPMQPLPNQPVRLEPWTPCRFPTPTTQVCPAPVAHTTTNAKGYFQVAAPPGHYLLVIGTDTAVQPPAQEWATVHDNVWLQPTPSVQHLKAPGICNNDGPPYTPTGPPYTPFITEKHCIPWVPYYPFTPPEASTNYRLTNLNSKMAQFLIDPSIAAYDALRAKFHRLPMVTDEWLLENAKAITLSRTAGHNTPGEATIPVIGFYAPLAPWALSPFQKRLLGSPQAKWYGGAYWPCCRSRKSSAYGDILAVYDQRDTKDWPLLGYGTPVWP